jgi:hypothetical protein
MPPLRPGRLLGAYVAAFVVLAAIAGGILSLTLSRDPVPVHVRWKPDTADAERATLEQRFGLTRGEVTEGTTRAYRLTDTTTGNIRALVEHPAVDDTAEINRVRFRPAFAYDRERRRIFFAALAGGIGALALLLLPPVSRALGLRRPSV